ncbi:SusD/RagB family nutrient-binding outer membrane lipoprotein [Sunxiuqinia elliptica]
MKAIYRLLILLFMVTVMSNCTSDFDEMNIKPDAFTKDEVSAKFFLTGPQVRLYAPDRFPYWRAHLIHADRYAGHFCFGFNGSWWSDALGYAYNSGYTDASWGWLAGYLGNLDNYMKLVKTGGEFENQYMYAIGLVMKGLYFQMYTDVFGMLPYSEAGNPDITLPKFDEQAVIYQGIIAELDEAMQIIGDETKTGSNVDDVGDNDLYFDGDLQKWKKLANTLKLRMGLRAYGAPGADFAQSAITQALGAPLLEASDENCLLQKDEIQSQWSSAAYGDVWYNFGTGSDWTVGKTLIDNLRNNNDPRLEKYAKPAAGGTNEFVEPDGPEAALFDKRVDYVLAVLEEAGAEYTRTDGVNDKGKKVVTIEMAENFYYIGQPTRLNGDTYPYSAYGFWSTPAEIVIQRKGSGDMFPEIVMTAAEGHFLQAEAIVKGFGSGDAQAHYQEGIRQAMLLWDVNSGAIETFLAEEDMAQLNGSTDEMLEKIATQRWIVSYTDGFEAWAIVRDTGYPTELAQGVSDFDIFAAGDINGDYPQRMRYGNQAINTNGANVNIAIGIQGPNTQDTKLWWAK